MRNKQARKELEKRYGKGCFIEKLHLRKDDTPRVYKSKGQLKRMKQLTYHHILEKSKGGRTSIENGAVLSRENHTWFHQQPLESQAQINEIFQKYKAYIDECKIEYVDNLKLPFEIRFTDFSIKEKKKEEPIIDKELEKEEER